MVVGGVGLEAVGGRGGSDLQRTEEDEGVNLTIRVNPAKRESQREKLERYFLECIS